MRLFGATKRLFQFSAHDVWTLFHSFAFDFSVWEIWGAYCMVVAGGRSLSFSRSPTEFLTLLAGKTVTVLNQTPAAFHQLMQADRERPDVGRTLALRHVIFGGEALDRGDLPIGAEHHPDSSPVLVNMYGITETTVLSATCSTRSCPDQPR